MRYSWMASKREKDAACRMEPRSEAVDTYCLVTIKIVLVLKRKTLIKEIFLE